MDKKRFIIAVDPTVKAELQALGYMMVKEDLAQGFAVFWNEPCRQMKFALDKCIFTDTLTF